MRALKTLVVVMGILIVGGVAVLVVAIANRGAEMDGAGVAPRSKFDPTKVTIPAGSRIVETVAAGDRLVLRLQLKDGGRRILVIDLSNGAKIGTIDLVERDGAQMEGAGQASGGQK